MYCAELVSGTDLLMPYLIIPCLVLSCLVLFTLLLFSSLNHRFRYRNLGAYSFQNAFFYLQFPDDPLATLAHTQAQPLRQQQPYAHTNPGLRASLVTQRKTRR